MKAAPLLVTVALGACHQVVALAPPVPERDHAVLILVLPGPRIWAADLREAGPQLPPLRFRASEPEPIYALYFECSLAGLGLIPGWQRLVAEGPALPPPSEALSATLGEDALAWTTAGELPGELQPLRLATSLECARFEPRAVLLEGTPGSGNRVLAPLGGDRYLYGSLAGRFFVVTRDSATMVDTPTTTPHAGAFTDSGGAVWLLGEGGRIARYREGEGFEPVGTTASQSGDADSGALIGSDALPPELFAVSNRGVIDHFDGTSWEVLLDDPFLRHDSPGVTLTAEGDAIAIGSRRGSAIIYDGTVHEERVVDGGLNAIASVAGLGTVIGTTRGQHWLRASEGGAWTRIPGAATLPVYAIASFGIGGFITGSTNGFVGQYHPQLGFCEPVQLGSNGIKNIAPSSTGFVLASIHEEHEGGAPDVLTFVDTIGAVVSCTD